MTPEVYQRVREAYLAVCDLPASERDERLQRLCDGDAELLAEVRSLLVHHLDDEEGLAGSELGLGERLLDDDPLGREPASNGDPHRGVPQRIGRFRILRRIGEGGMGIVFEAEQEHPNRKVALKLIRHGFESEGLLRRFQHEAELLGRLGHPGIAHVYEAGIHETATGAQIPYLAMELIHGQPLTEYASQRQLDTRARLALFAKACDAVEHAHQQGVIHRDLKPGNILVVDVGAVSDRDPSIARGPSRSETAPTAQPKILDFGIARATDGDVRQTTLRTSPGQLLGTVPYMSPEQACGDPAALDTRSDVYSLGVILYELLAGRLPYDLQDRSIVEAVRVIQETEPTRISALDRSYRGDIDTLLAKALEKEKSRRYGSAAELAADIRRYLADMPLNARPASSMYQLRKFARRNRVLVTAAGLCVLLLMGGIAGTTSGWLSARRANRQLGDALAEAETQRDLARASEARATTELARSNQVTRLIRTMLKSVSPAIAAGRDTTILREILESAVKKMDSGEIADQPAVEAEMRATIADTYNGLGDNAAALGVLEPAIRLARAAPGDEAGQYRRARLSYASMLTVWDRRAEALAEYEQAMDIQERFGPEDELAGEFYSNFGGLQATLGKTEEALSLHRRALEVRRRVFGEKHANVTASMGNIAGCLKDLQRYDEAIAIMREVLQACRDLDPPRPLHLTIILNNLAGMLLLADHPAEAEAAARESLEIGTRIYKPEHQQMGMGTHTLGTALRAQGRHEEARDCFARAAEILTAAFNNKHGFVATARMDLGIELATLGRFPEAERELVAAHAIFTGATGRTDESSAECAAAVVNMYEAWNQADPGRGHDALAVQWRSRLRPAQSQPTSQPTHAER